ncbi:hypothetical protein USB125703_00971 [Pseudoclavibacter triregionum]|nr:hypothetical protein USB125703_00971 [Pseudoclavibacter triregionum]
MTTVRTVDPRKGSPPLARGARDHRIERVAEPGITPARAGSTGCAAGSAARERDHPRSRGEHMSGRALPSMGTGSPPLARGAHRLLPVRRDRPGITPARAGSTRRASSTRPCRGDHPRSRGEHWQDLRREWANVGSPPLARGALLRVPVRERVPGITPARAGSTQCRARPTTGVRDHPRSRGEHCADTVPTITPPGSPPLARGARRGTGAGADAPGITPARAGSTGRASRGGRRRRDHPRSRGEHGGTVCGDPISWGSPPLARGARDPRGPRDCWAGITEAPRVRWRRFTPPLARGALDGRAGPGELRGITPARTGSTAPRRHGAPCRRDHPRSRGEHRAQAPCLRCARGSPPLARGALPVLLHERDLRGITPARAGSTRSRWRRRTRPWDHPRSRGEHDGSLPKAKGYPGSPPLARGAPPGRDVRGTEAGITPARAGSTPRRRSGAASPWDHPRSRGEHAFTSSVT